MKETLRTFFNKRTWVRIPNTDPDAASSVSYPYSFESLSLLIWNRRIRIQNRHTAF